MELKLYLRILLRKWWIILPVFLVTFTATVAFTFTQPPTYSAVTTYIVAPNAEFGDVRSFANGLDILSRRAEIATTYTEVASSRRVKQEAAQLLGLSESQRRDLSVESKLYAGTNVLEIAVEGPDPELVRDFADTVGQETMKYAEELYETYILTPLDKAALPTIPIKPNKVLNLGVGGFLGFALGVGLAFLATYLETPVQGMDNFEILDEESNAYNKRYFMQRLGEEMVRSKRNHYPLSIALLSLENLTALNERNVNAPTRRDMLQMVAASLTQYIREEDVLARLNETMFALMLLDMPEQAAQAMIHNLLEGVSESPFKIESADLSLDLSGSAGIATYNFNGAKQDELLSQASHALQRARAAGYGQVSIFKAHLSQNVSAKK